MHKKEFTFTLRKDIEPHTLIFSHLLRIEEKLIRQEFLLHHILKSIMNENDLQEFINIIDLEAEKMKFELLADIVGKYGE